MAFLEDTKELKPGLIIFRRADVLHAREIRFELPLGGKRPEVISIFPQSAEFQRFSSACHFGLAAADAEVAKLQASANAVAAQTAKETADAKANRIALAIANEQRDEDVQYVCLLGKGMVRSLRSNQFMDMSNHTVLTVFLKKDELIQTEPTDAKVAAGHTCNIVVTRDGVARHGAVSTTSLAVADTKQ